MSKLNIRETLSETYDNGYESVNSFNCQSTLNDETELLIVGTLTPPDGSDKYFYSTSRNRIYGHIDAALNNNVLVAKKKEFIDNDKENNKRIRNEIKEYLKDKKIAFLDVIKEAIRKEKSSKDDDIIECTLDYERFKKAKNVKYIIVNSKAAEDALKRIFERVFDMKTYNEKVVYLPQRGRNSSRDNWKTAIEERLK